MPPVPKAPVVAPLITWLDAHEFSPPREPAVGATAWYEQNDHRWAGALHYLKNETLHGPPNPGVSFQWVFKGFLGPMHDTATHAPVSSFLELGFGFYEQGAAGSSMFDGYAEAKGLPQQFGQQPLVLMNGNDSVHCIRGVIEVGDDTPKLWFTLGPIYTFA